MTDLFWPGDERAGFLFSGDALLDALLEVESAWLGVLVSAGIAPAGTGADLTGLLGPDDVPTVALRAEAGGNPVIPMVGLLRERLRGRDEGGALWVHRGLTSQDVLDTAIVLCLRDVLVRLQQELSDQIRSLIRLARQHRDAPMVARTLTQHAVPTTFGVKAAQWLTAVLDAADGLGPVTRGLPAQFGGAAGTLAAIAELASGAGLADPPGRALGLAAEAAESLGLRTTTPWHTARGPVSAAGDALVGCTDAWGRIARDVATLSRPEIGELREPAGPGRGGSSTMPQKHNPVLAVLVRRAALSGPGLGAILHAAAADAGDERPDGAWHVEWATLRSLSRQTVVAASQTSELLRGLHVDTDRMLATLDRAGDAVLAERDGLAGVAGTHPEGGPTSYLGAAGPIVDAVLIRARNYLQESE